MTEEQKDLTESEQAELIYKYGTPKRAPGTLDAIVSSKTPKQFYLNNTKYAKRFTDGVINNYKGIGSFEFILKDDEIELTTLLNTNLTGTVFNAYDVQVLNAIDTLYAYGNEYITSQMIYRAMNGLTDREFVNFEAIQKIENSIDKFRFTHMIIDATPEATKRKLKNVKVKFDDAILSARKVVIEINGNINTSAYFFKGQSLLYDYAQTINKQIISVPLKLLDTKKAIRNTSNITVIRNNLITQIEWIKKGRNNAINYDELFKRLNINVEDKRVKNKQLNNIRKILAHWVEQDYIKDYEEYKTGRSISGVKIKI